MFTMKSKGERSWHVKIFLWIVNMESKFALWLYDAVGKLAGNDILLIIVLSVSNISSFTPKTNLFLDTPWEFNEDQFVASTMKLSMRSKSDPLLLLTLPGSNSMYLTMHRDMGYIDEYIALSFDQCTGNKK